MNDEAWRETVKRDSGASEATRLKPGDAVGRFLLESMLGRGGMGEVWKARDPELGRAVAIKFLLGASLEDQKRFQAEAQVVAGLGHPNIAPVFEAGSHDGRGYFVMRYLEGETLDRAKLALPDLLRAVKGAAEVLHHAHQKGVIHRDIKPGNLMLSGGQVYVMDFGLARTTEARGSLSLSGTVVGTPAYMSPEQARGVNPLDARTDVYSLGATLYELVAGRPPFAQTELFALLEAVVAQDPPSLKGPPEEVATIVRKAMEKDRERRYPTAAAFAEDVDRYLSGRPILAKPPGLAYRLRKHAGRHPAVWAAGLIALLALAAGGVFVRARGLSEARLKAETRAEVAARGRSEERLKAAAELSRTAASTAKDAKGLFRIRTSTRPEWERLFAEAVELARRSIDTAPELAGGYSTLGLIQESRHQWAEAVAAYDEALKRDPDLLDALYHRSFCRMELYQDLVGVSVRIERFAERESAAERRARGESLKSGAIADLERYRGLRGAAYDSSREKVYVEGAFALIDGRYAEAGKAADALLADSKIDEMVWFLKARSFGSSKKTLGQAVAVIDELIRDVMPNFSRAWHARGLYKARLEDHAGAREDFARAVELDPASWRSRFRYARESLELGDAATADREYTAGLEIRGSDAEAYYGRARARESLGRSEDALADFEAALKLEPVALSVRYDLGRVKLALGRPAQEDFAAAAEKAPRPDADDLRGALDHWTRLIERRDQPWPRFQRALVRRERGDAKGALEDLDQAIRLNPAFASAHRYRGDFDKAVELHPGYAEAWYDRGLRREGAGDRAGAAADYAKALAVADRSWPTFESCEKALARVR